MRHFLKFLPIDKRAEAERRYETTKDSAAPKKPPLRPKISLPSRAKASVPPRVKVSLPTPGARPESKKRSSDPRSPAGPEFGGLIERRKQSREESRVPQSPPVASRAIAKTAGTAKSWDTRFDIDANDVKAKIEARAGESTGKFLASLDNSALTLADSGLFKVDPEEEPPEASFDPYDRN